MTTTQTEYIFDVVILNLKNNQFEFKSQKVSKSFTLSVSATNSPPC